MTRSIDGSIRKAGIKSALLFIALLCSVSGSATTYYVNDNDGENYYSSGPGSNMNYGTINAPFSSISTALTYCFSGDTVLVDPGTYNENIIISVAVTILGPNTGIPGYHQSNRNPEAIINSPYIRAIEIHSGICTISGFTITNTQDLSNERYMIKAGNFFTNGNNITRLNFTDNILRKYHTAPGGFALMIQDNSGISRQISIVDNLIDSTTSVSGGIAVWVSGIDNTISRNRLNTLNYDAINLSAGSGNLRAEVTQNYINDVASGIVLQRSLSGSRITGNTVTRAISQTGGYNGCGIVFAPDAATDSVRITNNLLLDNLYAVCLWGFGNTNSKNIISKNLFSSNLQNSKAVISYWYNTGKMECNVWGNGSGPFSYLGYNFGGLDSIPYIVSYSPAANSTQTGFFPTSETSNLSVTHAKTNALCSIRGTITVNFSGATSPYTIRWYTAPSGTLLGTDVYTGPDNGSYTITGLAPGSYDFEVTCATGCSYRSGQITILNDPIPFTVSNSIVPIRCSGGTGSILLSVSGTANYDYSWTGPNGIVSSSKDLLNVPAGTYTVSVTDPANGCNVTQTIVLPPGPGNLSVTISNTAISCNGGTSILTASASGGAGNYSYQWSSGETVNPITKPAGSYSVTVTDGNGCSSSSTKPVGQPSTLAVLFAATSIKCNGGTTSLSVIGSGGTSPYSGTGTFTVGAGTFCYTIADANGCTAIACTTLTEPTRLTTSISSTPISCFGGTSTLTASASGGTSPYSYQWSSGETINPTTKSAGTYSVTVTDGNGCTATDSETITQPLQLRADTANVIQVNCTGTRTGSVVITASGGTSPYTGTGLNQGLGAGTYFYTVTDALGCTATTSVTITQPNPLVVVDTLLQAIRCFGGRASVKIDAIGGTPPYSGTGTFSLIAGNYTYLVTDVKGCTASKTISVTQPSTLAVSISSITPVSCFGGNNGSVFITASGGTPPYSGDGLQSGLGAGTHTFTVTDANQCSITASATINQPAALTLDLSADSIKCRGGSTVIHPVASGGTSPYSPLLDSTVTAGGPYIFTVTDSRGCTTSKSITISQPDTLIALSNATTVKCFGDSATVTITAIGGVWPYNGAISYRTVAGYQCYMVTDANACTATTCVFIPSPTLLTTTATVTSPILCYGGNSVVTVSANGGTPPYSGTGGITHPAGTYCDTVRDANGCKAWACNNITEPTRLIAKDSLQTNASCAGRTDGSVFITASGGTAPYTGTGLKLNLGAGIHTYTVTDANGCTATISVTITTPGQLTASITSFRDPSCNNTLDGYAQVSVSGGTPPLVISWNTTPTQTGLIATNLGTGIYRATVRDSNGCSIVSNDARLIAPSQLVSSVSNTPIQCFGENSVISVTASGGTYPYQGTGTFTRPAGSYILTVTDSNGCITTAPVTITQPTELVLRDSAKRDVSCFGGNNGSVYILASGGTPPYTGAGIKQNLNARTHNYTVTDANGCSKSITVDIAQPPVLLATATEITPIRCFGGNATLRITASGGTGPYTIFKNGSGNPTVPFVSGDTFIVVAGQHCYTITDAKGCTQVACTTVTQPPLLVAQAIGGTILCNGGSTTVTISATGGTPTYNGTTSFTTGAGSYCYTVTDDNGCKDTACVILREPSKLEATSVQTSQIACFGGTAQIQVSSTGGTLPYSGTGPKSHPAGTFIDTVTDGNGCIDTARITISQPALLIAGKDSVSNVSCNGLSNGSFRVTASGGTGPYTGTGWRRNLAASTYPVTVTDANGCSSIDSVTITQPDLLVATASNSPILCNGGNSTVTVSATGGTTPYTGTGNFTRPASAYTFTVIDANGCQDTAGITITEPSLLTDSETFHRNVNCYGRQNGATTVQGAGGTSSYSYLWSNGATTAGITGLAAGSYTVTVTDANGCTNSKTILISQPDRLVSAVTSHVDIFGCHDVCNGRATVTTTGGTRNGPLNYSWNPASTMQDSIAVALCKGYYVVTVTDANGCTATAGVNINGPDSIILSTQTTSVSCFGGSNGSASATVTGGIPPFRYLWSNGATTSTASNLAEGSYTLTVTDSSGCVKTNSVTIQQASPIEVTIFRQPILCFGGTTIDSVTATGGTAPYTGTGNFTRSAGANCYTVTDNRSCSVVKCDTVSQPTIVRITGFTATQILCNGGQSSVCVNATGGTGTLNYRWNTNETTMCIVRPAGSSSVRVTDQNGCSADSSTTISQPLPLVAADSARRNPTCNGGTNGSVCITATGGTLPYTGTGCYSNLSAGSYPYIVSDFNGCTDTTIVVITAPAPVTANIIYHDDVIGCQGDCNGSAFVLAGGGTPPYRYLWSNNDRSAISCDLCAGGYTVRVTDAVGCSASTSVIIDEPDTLIASITATQIACFGGSGSMSVTATGGVGPYSYLWEDGDNDTLHQQLGGSTRHTVTVMDDYGCVATDTDSILSAPDPLNITYTAPAIACWGGCTDICITVVGGTPGYNYNWNTGSTSNCTYCVRAGNDTVVVTDRNGCTATKCITITQPDPLVVTITGNPIACYGGTTTICANISGGTGPYSYRWSDNSTGGCLSSVGAGSYNVTVTDVNGCTQTAYYTVQSAPSRLTLSLSTVQILCHGQKGTVCATVGGGTTPYTYRWSNNRSTSCIDSLSPGTYWVSITDANGCVISDTATIRPEPAKLVVSANVQQILCYGGRGAINITATGGTAQLSYSWTGTNSFSSNQEDIALLLPGTYCVTVTDGNGCTATACGTINPQPDQIIITDTISSIKCFNGTGCVGVNVTGGVSPYRYLWSTGETTAIICGKFAGIYTVTVWDANNCVVGRNVVLGNAPAKLAISAVVSQPKCFGETGCLQISPSGGVTPYTYTWKKNGTPFANTKDICQLGNGVYCLQLKDSNNCTLDTCFTILSAPSQITVSKSVNQPKCFGLKGSVTLSTSGGTGTLTVNWRTCPCAVSNCPNPAPNPASLDPGTYYFTVTDANNCTVCDSVVINAPPAQIQIIDSTTQISCFGGTGCVKAIVAGGTSPYSYIWKNGTTQVGTTSQVCNLAAGTYCVTVTDNNGCTATKCSTINNAPAQLYAKATVLQPKCYLETGCIYLNPFGGVAPYSYTLNGNPVTSPACGLTQGNYSIRVYDANGCYRDTVITINQHPNQIIVTANLTQPKCYGQLGSITQSVSGGTPGFTYLWSNGATTKDISNLTPNTYNCTVTDANGCTKIGGPYVINNAPSQLILLCTAIQPKCFGEKGCIITNASGGTPPYTVTNPRCSGCNLSLPDTSCNLSAGNYTITVTDNYGCSTSTVITINQAPPQLSIAVIADQIQCSGGTGCVNVTTTTGGITPYNYVWKSGTTVIGTTTSVCSLNPGTYCATVTDNNGCSTSSCTTINAAPSALTLSTSSTPILCNGGTGCVSATATGGTGTLAYSWKNGTTVVGTSATLCNLAAGTYCVTVTDASGCTIAKCETISPAPPAINLIVSATQIACFGGKGCVNVTASGGTGGFTSYVWKNGTTVVGTGTSVCNLNAGTYCVTATDGNGCTATGCVIINAAPAPIVLTDSLVQPKCFGDLGYIRVKGSGGTRPFTFNWSNGSTDTVLTNLMQGTYTLQVTDANGCIKVASYTINAAPSAVAMNLATTQILCYNGKGKVVISPTGGTSPYRLSYTGCASCPIFNPPWTIDTLSPGTYTFTVTDANGCTAAQNVTIRTAPTALSVTHVVTQPGCWYSTGSIAQTVSGGTTPYTYSWSNGANTRDLTGLAAGTYTCIVTDANGCSITKSSVISSAPLALTVTCSVVQPLCYGQKGTVNVTVTGGSGTYTYLWNNNATTSNLTNADPGTYSVTVTDANGCSQSTCCIIVNAAPSQLVIAGAVQQPLCSGQTGNITLTLSGGTTPYSFVWKKAGSSISFNQNIDQLTAGTYDVTVTDANGCSQTAIYTISAPPAAIVVTPTVVQPLCSNDLGSVTTQVTGGTGTYTCVWTNYPANCSGCQPYSNNCNITNVPGGIYTITVTDAAGCIGTACVTINYPPDPIVAHFETIQPLCSGSLGSIDLTPTGGTGPYTYNWTRNGTAYSTNQDISLLNADTYVVTITDNNNCTGTDSVVIIPAPATAIAIQTNAVQIACSGGTGCVSATASGGAGNFTYVWKFGTTIIGTGQQVCGLAAGTYCVTVTDGNGCSTSGCVTINPAPAPLTVISDSTQQPACLNNTGCIYISVTGGTAPYSYLWSNGATTQDVCGLAPGNYSVQVTDANGCSKHSATYTINQSTTLSNCSSISKSGPVVFCQGGSVTLSACTGATYLWNNGSTASSITVTTSGCHWVTISSGSCSTRTDTVCVTVNPNPTIIAPADTTICQGSCVTLCASGATNYLWSNGFATSCINVCPNITSIFSVTGTDANGCTGRDTVRVNVTTPVTPTVSITNTPSGQIFQSTSVTFSVSAKTNEGTTPTYTWYKNGAQVQTGSSTTYTNSNWISGDMITCIMSSSLTCVTSQTATSNAIILNVSVPAARYLIVDPTANRAFYYDSLFAFVSSSPLSTNVLNGTTNASDVVCANNTVFVLDGTLNKVYRSNGPGVVSTPSSVLRSNTNTGLNPLTGIYVLGNQLFVLDKKGKAIYQYGLNQVFTTSATVTATRKLTLNSGNSTAESMTIVAGLTDTLVYVLDNGNSNVIYRYKLSNVTGTTSLTYQKTSKKLVTNTGVNLSKATGTVVENKTLWVTDNVLDRALGFYLDSLFFGSYSTSTVWRAHLVNGLSINNGLSTGITLVSNTSLIRTVNPDEPTAEPSTVAGNEQSLLLNSYPNPTGGSVTIRVSGLLPDQDTRIRIVDITGRSIYTEVIGSGYEIYEQVFDLYDHPAGIYLVMVEQNDRREFIRVLKQ